MVAGLAISAFPHGAITDELTIIDDIEGFAALPPVELAIHRSSQRKSMPELEALVEHLSEYISRKMAQHKVSGDGPTINSHNH